MAKAARFTPVQTRFGWRINIPPKFSKSGVRERHHYPTKQAAYEAAKEFRNHRDTFGQQARAIAPSLAEDAHAAAQLLKPLGIRLLDAVQQFVASEQARRASVAIEVAVAEFQLSKEDMSLKYTQSIRQTLDPLLAKFAGRLLSTITGEEVGGILEERVTGPAAYNAKLRVLRTFWEWSAKRPRGWCQADALHHLERRAAVAGETGVLTAEQARDLLATAEAYYPECIPGFAIALFTGMRQQELLRLDPEDIKPEGITVPALSSKTKKRRFIRMSEPLKSWLAAYPVEETVLPSNWRRREQAVRRKAGWRVWCNLFFPAEAPEDLPLWPNNGLRHTAASVAVALGKDLTSLIFEHGHTGGVQMLQRHYVGKMSAADAKAIQRLGPNGTTLPDPEATEAAVRRPRSGTKSKE